MRQKTILILGAGIMQIPSIRIAKRKGWRVLVADGDPSAPGVALADLFEHVDLSSKEEMLSMAGRYRDRDGLDGVFTAGTDFSTTVAWVTEHLGLPGIPYEVALRAKHKGLMRARFAQYALPSPAFEVVNLENFVAEKFTPSFFPLVVKPVDSMGARGIRLVQDSRELQKAVEEALGFSKSSEAIIEEYLDGPEFSVDALCYNGKVEICGIADRRICFPPYFVEMGHTMPTDQENLREEVLDVFTKGVRALGISLGAAKGDMKYTAKGAVIGEIAARLSGGFMSGWTYPYSSGVEVTAAALDLAMGATPARLTPQRTDVSAEKAFISIPGRIHSIFGLERARTVPFVKELFLRVKKGDRVTFPRNNVEKCGNVITQAPTREKALTSAFQGCNAVLLRLEPGDLETSRFLRGKSSWIPYAYTLKQFSNKEAFDTMPLVTRQNSGNLSNISILSLPCLEEETAVDWQGRGIQEAFRIVLDQTKSGSGEHQESLGLGKLFWHCFLKGGVQGGIWLIDTVKAVIRTKGTMKGFLELWNGLNQR